MPDISLTDYSSQLAANARQQRMAELLQNQSMEPIQVMSANGVQAPIPWTAVLAKVLQAGAGAYASNRADKRAAKIKADRETKSEAALSRANAPTFRRELMNTPVDLATSMKGMVPFKGSASPQDLSMALQQGTPAPAAPMPIAQSPNVMPAPATVPVTQAPLVAALGGTPAMPPAAPQRDMLPAPTFTSLQQAQLRTNGEGMTPEAIAVLQKRNQEAVGPVTPMPEAISTMEPVKAAENIVDKSLNYAPSDEERMKILRDVIRNGDETSRAYAVQDATALRTKMVEAPKNAAFLEAFGPLVTDPVDKMIFEGYVSQNDRPGALKALEEMGIKKAALAAAKAQFDETVAQRELDRQERARSADQASADRREMAAQSSADRRLGYQMTADNAKASRGLSASIAGLTNNRAIQGQVLATRKEFDALPEIKAFKSISQAYKDLKSASGKPSAAGDLSIIFGYMKMLDPTSVVREGEQASAANATGVPDRILNIYNKVAKGQRLNPNQRQDFINQASLRYQNNLQRHNEVVQTYSGYADQIGVDPKYIVGNENYKFTPAGVTETAPAPAALSGTLSPAEQAELSALRRKHPR
jgi:hypothetical protein